MATWILRQEALGYAPSYSQVRTVVETLLKSISNNKPLGQKWLNGFKSRNPSIKTKIGRRIEVSRFDAFTPKAVNWYFDIRKKEYSWIKPELIYNINKGGIIAGFGIK